MDSMTDYFKYFKNFTCPKCRGKSFVCEEATLCSMSKRLLLRAHDSKYILVTCGLCGFTEIYSTKVLASIKEEIPVPETTPILEKTD